MSLCIQDASVCIRLVLAHFLFFQIRGRTVQPPLSCNGLSNYNVQRLYSATQCILLYFSIAQ